MSNDSVRGYIILVLKNLNFDLKDIEKVLDELHYVFDTTSEYEALQYYYNRKWQEEGNK